MKIIINSNLKQEIFKFIWDTSEFLHIGLGRFAPYVFERAFNVGKGVKL